MAWITVDVGLVDHPKLTDLPSDSARYGWLVTLVRAKAQRKPGWFASKRHYREVVGRFGKFLPDYLKARLLEEHEDGSLSVHDWERHQYSVRQQVHRDKSVTSALPQRDGRVTDRDRDIDKRVSSIEEPLSVRARNGLKPIGELLPGISAKLGVRP